MHDITEDVRQSVVPSGMPVGQSCVIETEEMKNRCVQVVNMHPVFHGLETELVCRAVHRAAFDAPTGHPVGKPPMVMIPAVYFSLVGSFLGEFHNGRPPEFASPDNERFFQ